MVVISRIGFFVEETVNFLLFCGPMLFMNEYEKNGWANQEQLTIYLYEENINASIIDRTNFIEIRFLEPFQEIACADQEILF